MKTIDPALSRPCRRLWLGAVMRAIAKVPAGEKLRVGDMARSLQLAQADVIACIELLIDEGRLDGATLRPPESKTRAGSSAGASEPLQSKPHKYAGADHAPSLGANGNSDATIPPVTKVAPARGLLPTGQQLFRQLRDEGAARGMSPRAVSIAAFGSKSQMTMMRQGGTRPVQQRTWAKAQAWLANPVPAPARSRPVTTGISGAVLAAEIDAFLARTGMKPSRFGRLALGGSGGGVKRMRSQPSVTDAVVRRVRDFMANPPAEALVGRARRSRLTPQAPSKKINSQAAPAEPTAGDGTPPAVVPPSPPPAAAVTLPAPRRDPTQRPDTPLMDVAERQRLNGAQRFASVRRGHEAEATALVDAGIDPSAVKSTFQGNMMRQVIARREAEARAADPVEQAKLALRQRGRVVFCASVYNGPKGRFFVSGIVDEDGKRKLLTGDDLIIMANRVNPRAMRAAAATADAESQERKTA